VIKKAYRKVVKKGLNIISKIAINIFDTEITDAEFLKKVLDSKYQFENLKELKKYFSERKEPRFFIPLSKQENTNLFDYEDLLKISNKITAEADKICGHIFNLLGSGDTNLGEKIDWHCDFKSGYHWNPKRYYRDIEIPYGRADIKVPWELSRFQHFTVLGQAYWLTGNEKYSKEFVSEIEDWTVNNRPKFGVNWNCTMDVAIRVCNWIIGYCYFKNSSAITDEFLLKFLKSIYQHGKHIMANLELQATFTSNHYLSDIVGLVYLGVMFPEFKDASHWRKFGIRELIREMKKQVYSDGCDFEASTCYHRLVLELFFFTTLLVVVNEKDFKGEDFSGVAQKIFGEEYVQKLYKMFEFVLYALKPNGTMPQIGDNDNGRLHIFAKREVLDMQYLLTLGAIFFKEPKFKVREFGFCEEALWVFGERGYKIWRCLTDNCLADISSKAFPDAGWYIMRSDKNYIFISCGPNGQNGNGGHCHNDKLSFELCVGGEDIIVDSGTYVYTSDPEARNKFRGRAYHNTVMIDEQEQNRFDKYILFGARKDAITKCLKWEVGGKVDIFIGEYYGYQRYRQSVIHQREIRFHKKRGELIVIDEFKGKENYNLEWNLILSPEFRENLKVSSDKLHWHRELAFYSPEYGVIIKTEKLTTTLRATNFIEVKFLIKM